MALTRDRLFITGILMAALWLLPVAAAAQSGTAAKGPDSKAMIHALEDAFASVAEEDCCFPAWLAFMAWLLFCWLFC